MFKTSDKLLTGNGDQLKEVIAGLAVITAGADKNIGSVNEMLERTGRSTRRSTTSTTP